MTYKEIWSSAVINVVSLESDEEWERIKAGQPVVDVVKPDAPRPTWNHLEGFPRSRRRGTMTSNKMPNRWSACFHSWSFPLTPSQALPNNVHFP